MLRSGLDYVLLDRVCLGPGTEAVPSDCHGVPHGWQGSACSCLRSPSIICHLLGGSWGLTTVQYSSVGHPATEDTPPPHSPRDSLCLLTMLMPGHPHAFSAAPGPGMSEPTARLSGWSSRPSACP